MSEDDRLAALVRLGRQLDAEIRDLGERKRAVIKALDEVTDVGWKLVVDGVPASKKLGNRTFSPALALERFTVEEKLSVISTGIDFAAVRALADNLGFTEECMVSPETTSVKLG